MACGNKEHFESEEIIHPCGICLHWNVNTYFNPEKMPEECKKCKEGDCQFIDCTKNR